MGRLMGLIAGGGRLPVAIAKGIRASGRGVMCVGFHGMYDPQLPTFCDVFKTAGFIQIGRWIRLLREHGVDEAVMVGYVAKTRMYDPLYWIRQIPDLTAARIWYSRRRQDRRTQHLLAAVADAMEDEGIRVLEYRGLIPDHFAEEGVLTAVEPSQRQWRDIHFGMPIAVRMEDLDIGQSIAVKNGEVIAVEAVDGTDALIERAGKICRTGGWTLIKAAKPSRDMRLDVPTVGPTTLNLLHRAGGRCIAVSSGRTIILEPDSFISAANAQGIPVVGVAH